MIPKLLLDYLVKLFKFEVIIKKKKKNHNHNNKNNNDVYYI